MKEHLNSTDNNVQPISKSFSEFMEDAKRKIKSFYKKLLTYLIPLLIVSIIFIVLLTIANAKIETLEAKLRAALQEKEHVDITFVHIEEKLSQISELATMSFGYTNQKTINNTRQVLGVDIPGTKNTVDIIYSGVIKVGYDITNISYEIDKDRKLIRFTLPEPQVLDNYIILDNLKCSDTNNILNPIGSEQIMQYFADIQNEELNIAIEKGIYIESEVQIKSIIENFFAAFPDYLIVFTS